MMRSLQQSSSSASRNLVGYYIASRWHQQQQTHSPSNKRKRTSLIYSHRLFNSLPPPFLWKSNNSLQANVFDLRITNAANYSMLDTHWLKSGPSTRGSTDSMGKRGTRIFWSWWTDGGCIFACFVSLYGHLAIFRDECVFYLIIRLVLG